MSAKAIGLTIFYCVSLSLLAVSCRHRYVCRRDGGQERWFLSALIPSMPVLMVLAPFVLYAQEAVFMVVIALVVMAGIGLRVWASFSYLTEGGVRPFRFRYRRPAEPYIEAGMKKWGEGKANGDLKPPLP